ncbi:hypothetical protein Pla100_60160 [Neorhodopirellula pilleata]|uniref:Uncharacterized protein n=1 Tax=Neorhodopirellula pilleata TaxID=2714738 RepID=A0A5C5ZIL3_9BACT|nr:hypothetical protein Pla100_60160 [Neorhodopirellula pilleata]
MLRVSEKLAYVSNRRIGCPFLAIDTSPTRENVLI